MRTHGISNSLLRIGVPTWILLASTGCGQSGRIEPPVIHPGEDVCARCNMIINEVRFAVAHVGTDAGKPSEPVLFDDVACLIKTEDETQERSVVVRWANAVDEPGWVDASSAYFVISPAIRSPMGGGVLATRSEDGAKALLERTPGKLLRFEELRLEIRKGQSHGS